MGMNVCAACRQVRYLSKYGLCVQCMREIEEREKRAQPDRLRDHPDLEEFDDYADSWYR